MALSSAKRLSHYGAVVRDSSRVIANYPLGQAPKVCESTVAQLIDKKTNEQLFIVGTTNLSTRLAHRTKKLIEAYQPDAVLVQASDVFHEASRAPAASQEELTQQLDAQEYQEYLKSEGHLDFSVKSALYLYRRTLMGMFVHHTLRTPGNWRAAFTPGLEMKYALDYADSSKVPVFYAGEEFDAETHLRLMHIPGFDVIWPVLNYPC